MGNPEHGQVCWLIKTDILYRHSIPGQSLFINIVHFHHKDGKWIEAENENNTKEETKIKKTGGREYPKETSQENLVQVQIFPHFSNWVSRTIWHLQIGISPATRISRTKCHHYDANPVFYYLNNIQHLNPSTVIGYEHTTLY